MNKFNSIFLSFLDVLSIIGIVLFLYYLRMHEAFPLSRLQVALLLVATFWIITRFYYYIYNSKRLKLTPLNTAPSKVTYIWASIVAILTGSIIFVMAFMFLL